MSELETTARRVMVTGAAGGIGMALVTTLSADGWEVIGLDLPGSGVEGLSAIVPTATGRGVDLSDEAEVVAVVDEVVAAFGPVHALVNNAAVGPSLEPIRDLDAEHFRKTLAVNLAGTFAMTRAFLRCLEGRSGAVVNVASMAGVNAGPRRNAYAASKAGVISMTRSLASEFAPQGVRVCAVAPGYVRTPMVEALARSGRVDLQLTRRRIPLGRLARPDEIASVVSFLVSDRSAHLTGVVIPVDGAKSVFNQPGDACVVAEVEPVGELGAEPAAQTRVVVLAGRSGQVRDALVDTYRDTGDKVVRIGGDAPPGDELDFPCDPTDEGAVAKAFADIRARVGAVDVLVTVWPGERIMTSTLDQSAGDWCGVAESGLVASALSVREACRQEGRLSVVVNVVDSPAGGAAARDHAYDAVASGAEVFTRSLAAELGSEGARVLSVVIEESARDVALSGPKVKPQDVAGMVQFLTSSAASYVSGATVRVG